MPNDNIPFRLCQTSCIVDFIAEIDYDASRRRKEKAIYNILLCLQVRDKLIKIQYLDEGIFYLLGEYTPQEADDVLSCYERYGMLSMIEHDTYSGLYLYDGKTAKITDKNLHERIKTL